MTNYRYETESEEIKRKSSLLGGYKILSEPNPARNNFWNPILETIEAEEAVLLMWTKDNQTFEYLTKEEIDQRNWSGCTKKEEHLCIVVQLSSSPYHARGYWFVNVVYADSTVMSTYFDPDGLRTCSLMFNNRHEASSVKVGDYFDRNEQEIE